MGNLFIKKSLFVDALLLIAISISFLSFDTPDGSKVILFIIYFIALILYILYLYLYNVSQNSVVDINSLILIVLLYVFLLVYSSFNELSTLSTFLVLIVAIVIGFIFSLLIQKKSEVLVKLIKVFLFFNLCALLLQLISFYFFGEILNIHSMLIPFSEGKTYIIRQVDLARFTGLYNEPGSYATWVSLIVLILVIVEGRISKLAVASVISLLFTFSISALVYFLILSLTMIFNKVNKISYLKLTLLVVLFFTITGLIIIYSGVGEYVMWRFFDDSVVDGSTGSKIDALQFLSNSETSRFVFGSGFLINDCNECNSIQDSGFMFNLFFQFGFFSLLIIFVFIIVSKPTSILAMSLLFILFLSKVYIFNPIFWIAIFTLNALYLKKMNQISMCNLTGDY